MIISVYIMAFKGVIPFHDSLNRGNVLAIVAELFKIQKILSFNCFK